jgi:hypothetical protein
MMHPTIHSNGTSAKVLEENNMKVYEALNAVLDVIREAAPNGRDYYPQGPNAINTAMEEFSEHAQAIHKALEYFEAQIILIQGA